jgi:hypothetical protein
MQKYTLFWIRLRILLFIFLLGLSALFFTHPVEANQGGLVRLEITSPEQRLALIEQGIQVYARLFTENGQEVLLLPAEAMATLESARAEHPALLANTQVQLVAPEQAGEDYFLVRLTGENTLARLEMHTRVLEIFGPQAVVAGSPEVLEALHAEGDLHYLPLEPYPLREYNEGPTASDILAPDPYVQAMISQVSQTRLMDHVRKLSGASPVIVEGRSRYLLTRFTPNESAITLATRYVYDRLASLGLAVYYNYYDLEYTGIDYGERRNVIAEQTGLLYPEKVYLITAHMDSRREYDYLSMTSAPGADDNASGTTAVLTAAEILSQYSFAYTIRYVLFTGEEQLQKGSEPYAAALARQGEQVLGVLNLDMIGYDVGGVNQFELHARPGEAGDAALATTFRDVVSAYGLNLNPVILNDSLNFSDHASFWQRDYPAILAMEDFINPNWHKTSDTTGTLDQGYFTAAVKAAVGSLAHLAEFYVPNVSGAITHSQYAEAVPGAQIIFSGPGFSQSFTSAMDGSFQGMLPGGTYSFTVEAPGYAPYSQANIGVPDPLSGGQAELDADLCQLLTGVGWYPRPLPPQPGEEVTLYALHYKGSSPFTYAWHIEGGPSAPAPAFPFISFTFPEAGNYRVTLTVSNTCDSVETSTLLYVGGEALFLPKVPH